MLYLAQQEFLDLIMFSQIRRTEADATYQLIREKRSGDTGRNFDCRRGQSLPIPSHITEQELT
jgi:hypothetical protein